MQLDAVDVLVIGTGAAGLTAACVAAIEGARVAVLESSAYVGGTTAISGGMVWMPANRKMNALGKSDGMAQALRYLDETVPGLDHEQARQYIVAGNDALDYLEKHTQLRLRPVPVYPDYYPTLPGATDGGRVLEPVPVDGRMLGEHFRILRPPLPEFTLFGGMMISREDIPHLRRVGRSWRSTWHATRLLAQYARQRMCANRGTSLYLGNALAARLYRSALDRNVHVVTQAPVTRLIAVEGRVVGAEVEYQGQSRVIHASKGVILATGGISHDANLRHAYVPKAAGALTATSGSAEHSSGAHLAIEVGGALTKSGSQGAFWVPASRFVRPDGTHGVFPHTVTDRAKPGVIAVDRNAQRFVNEAVSYHEFVSAQLANAESAIPAWLVVDRRFLWKYGLGRVRPFSLSVSAEVRSGYLHRGRTIAELAQSIGVPPQTLTETVRQYNEHAKSGKDPLFHKGSDRYQQYLGDADCRPNPCVGPIEKGPFYAVAVEPADLGMAAGLVTDVDGRVRTPAGEVVPGLYACGNDRQSIMNGAYPGPGITLGPAITFAYLAARRCLSD